MTDAPPRIPGDIFDGDRHLCLLRAAAELARAINDTPGTDGSSTLQELQELRDGNDPGAYLDDLEARVGVDVEAARVFYTLATAPEEEFIDLWQTVASRYRMPVSGG